MTKLIKLILGIFNPGDSGTDEDGQGAKVAKALGTAAIVLGALLSLVNEVLEALAGTPAAS